MATFPTARRAFIFHGFGAAPEDHWFDWLAERLRAIGAPTSVPALSSPLEPDPERWAAEVADTLRGTTDHTVGAGTVVVAHSLGALTVLRHLATLDGSWRLGRLVLVAGFVDPLPALPNLDAFIGDGLGADRLQDLREHIDHVTVLRSDADSLVPTGLTDRLAALLGVSALVVPGAGHFLGADGITELPQAFDAVTGRG